MNAPIRRSMIPAPVPALALAEAAVDAWSRDRRAYDAGICDEPASWPYVHHTFDGDDAPTWSVRVVTSAGEVFVPAADIRAAREARRTSPLPGV